MKPKRSLAQLLVDAAHRADADNDLEVECPYCHATFSVDQRPDSETSESGQDDEDNEGDGAEGAEQDNDEFDNRRPIDRLNKLAKNLAASTNKQR